MEEQISYHCYFNKNALFQILLGKINKDTIEIKMILKYFNSIFSNDLVTNEQKIILEKDQVSALKNFFIDALTLLNKVK